MPEQLIREEVFPEPITVGKAAMACDHIDTASSSERQSVERVRAQDVYQERRLLQSIRKWWIVWLSRGAGNPSRLDTSNFSVRKHASAV
jgi:hypothetical protein